MSDSLINDASAHYEHSKTLLIRQWVGEKSFDEQMIHGRRTIQNIQKQHDRRNH